MPIHASGVGSFAGALVARIRKDHLFFTVQQLMPLGDIIDVYGRSDDGVHQTGLRVHPNMGFHAEVPLVALLNLVHLGVALTGLVLGRARCSNQGGIHHGARLGQRRVRRYEGQQIAPRHDLVHFFEQDFLARGPGAEIKAEVCLFHAVKKCNLRASIEVAGVEF